MESIKNTLRLDPVSINLGDVQLSPPTRDENGVSFRAKFQVCLVETGKTTIIGGVAGGALGGAGGCAFAAATDKNFPERAIQGIKVGGDIGAFLGALFGVKTSYERMVAISVRINDYVHPDHDTPEYREAKRLGTEIIKLHFNAEGLNADEYFCPISCELMKFPVLASDGRTYEYDKIAEWIQQHPEGIESSPFRIRVNTMNNLEHNTDIGGVIGRNVANLVSDIQTLSDLKQNDLDAQFKDSFRDGSVVLEEITNINPQQVVDKIRNRDRLLNKEIVCLNVVLKPFVEMTRKRHNAIFTTTDALLTEHLVAERITPEKAIELKTSLNEWYLRNKIA